jgi:hypothetical protein
MLLFGFHYGRLPLAELHQLSVKERSAHELGKLTRLLAVNASAAREHIQEYSQDVMKLQQGVNGTLNSGYLGFQALASAYPEFSIPRRRAKGVMASRWWSYTNISGMFFPFFMEANVNIAMPHSAIPSTTMHELAHTIGFARENEAEFAGFLAGIAHPHPDFVYSAWLNAYIYASNALLRVDAVAFWEASAQLSEGVRRDLDARREFWSQFQGPVAEASVRINDAYLRSNMQVDGIRSYGAVVDLLLAYFEDELQHFTDPEATS